MPCMEKGHNDTKLYRKKEKGGKEGEEREKGEQEGRKLKIKPKNN